MLKDAPRSFGAFDPENFDREFVGPIKATDALARSRNIPAVTLASELRTRRSMNFCAGGRPAAASEKYYGLALPLGGAEVTMEDLVRLYAMLANDGRLRPLRRVNLRRSAGRRVRMRLLSSGGRPFSRSKCSGKSRAPADQPIRRGRAVFWKTGTSHGFRDAWSVAVFDHYVLAVWIGNFDGRKKSGLRRPHRAPRRFCFKSSTRCARAGPTALDRIAAARSESETRRVLCRLRPTAGLGLPASHEGWFIPGVSPISTCEMHREVLVDAATGLRVARTTEPGCCGARFMNSGLRFARALRPGRRSEKIAAADFCRQLEGAISPRAAATPQDHPARERDDTHELREQRRAFRFAPKPRAA